MYKRIAVAGKGGTGKTSLTGLIINYLVQSGKGPILAVDADSNSNLNEVLGIDVEQDIGRIREEVNWAERKGTPIPGGMTKNEYLEYQLNSVVSEGNGFDMLVMGRTQGEGCYCFVNGILKRQIEKLSNNYNHTVIDNEAGMEHISRGTVGNMDLLLLVSDYSRRSIQAVGRIQVLAEELKLNIPKVGLIVNKAPNGELTESIMEEIQNQNLNLIGVVPLDPMISEYDAKGIPLVQMPEEATSKQALKDILNKLQLI
ncbi:CO dehydrogenase maturation factor [Alkalibaculum bacchi]|uniref:CO dehydrogenase maturation factor n=1 Tax=Alkalibaculum bacchi TaxID=645887 RepID=A0A366ID91_9FIRM|nr:AAA family ATPase [Alkalibaculum bacchi]RBP68955.1 CO dehydrogenase maturation factor [Alkalibaculum bacchi]